MYALASVEVVKKMADFQGSTVVNWRVVEGTLGRPITCSYRITYLNSEKHYM
jgi:hypothetical protein